MEQLAYIIAVIAVFYFTIKYAVLHALQRYERKSTYIQYLQHRKP
jgi:hypothetical protein